jgi:hypothetical protein
LLGLRDESKVITDWRLLVPADLLEALFRLLVMITDLPARSVISS